MHNGLNVRVGGHHLLVTALGEAKLSEYGHLNFHGKTFVPGSEASLAAYFQAKGTTGKKKKKYGGEIAATQKRVDALVCGWFPREEKEGERATLVDTRYRERAFVKPPTSPFYFYPTLSTPNREFDASRSGARKPKRFVMASYLFGLAMRGLTETGEEIPLIDHHLRLPSKIIDITVDSYPHPYEAMIFSSVKSLFETIKTVGDAPFTVRYHLPVLDYMLYGMRLFLRSDMTREALEKYIEQVHRRGEFYRGVIKTLADQADIKIHIESPFDNLFGRKAVSAQYFMTVFSDLEPLEHAKENLELLFAQKLAYSLCANAYVDEHRAVWQTIFSHIDIASIKSLEDLFRLANSAEIAFACSEEGIEHFDVCSLLPADEEPIFSHYVRSLREHFKEVAAFLWLPAVLSAVRAPEPGGESSHKSYNLFRLRQMAPHPLLMEEICGASLPDERERRFVVETMQSGAVRLFCSKEEAATHECRAAPRVTEPLGVASLAVLLLAINFCPVGGQGLYVSGLVIVYCVAYTYEKVQPSGVQCLGAQLAVFFLGPTIIRVQAQLVFSGGSRNLVPTYHQHNRLLVYGDIPCALTGSDILQSQY